MKIHAIVAVMMIAENTANWETPAGCGLPPSYLIIQKADGASFSTMGMWATAI